MDEEKRMVVPRLNRLIIISPLPVGCPGDGESGCRWRM